VIRPATLDDVPGVVTLESEAFDLAAWAFGQVRDEIEGPGRWARVMTRADGRIVGFVSTRAAGDVVDLMRIAVLPSAQGRGVGGLLLTAALEAAAGTEAERMLLEVGDRNDPAIALYRRHGFAVIDRRRRYYVDGSDALVMSRSLDGQDG